MLVPTDIAGALLIVILVVPGFAFGTVRAAVRAPTGASDTQLTSRIAAAVMTSIVFDAIYLILLGIVQPRVEWLRVTQDPGSFLPREPHLLGITVLILGFVIPVGAALGLYYRVDWRPLARPGWPRWVRKPVRRGGYRNFPTAWDRAAPGAGGTFVRVRLEDGKWIGGWFSSSSFVSTYPHTRDLFIEQQYRMKKDGTFGEAVEGSSGVWLAIGDADVVEWITSPFTSKEEGEES